MNATEMDEAIPPLKEIIAGLVGEEGTTRLCTLLQETGSLIAGGSVLQSYQRATHDEEQVSSKDIDIYVPIRNILRFKEQFLQIVGDRITIEQAYHSSLYCNSFLQKNGIKKVISYYLRSHTNRSFARTFDIMIVRNRRTPLQVVNNFDLTFCQIWFDGEHIYASHPEHIRQKKGILQGEYVNLFLQGNDFLKARLRKYGNRGYEIGLDPTVDTSNIVSLLKYTQNCLKLSSDVLYPHWASRVLLRWFLKMRNTIASHEGALTPSIHHDDILVVPMIPYSSQRISSHRDNLFGAIDMEITKVPSEDDGYDSEDYTDTFSFYEMARANYVRTPTDLARMDQVDTSPLLFHREANRLLELALWPVIYHYRTESLNEYRHSRLLLCKTLGYLIDRYGTNDGDERGTSRFPLYETALRSRCVRTGTSFITSEEDVPVYDLHEHPLEAGISAEDMEGYLSHYVTNPNKESIPCYYKPNPHVPEDPVNCTKGITMSEVKYIVSKEFYERYSAPAPEKLGLDQFMSHYNQTLQNAKEDTPGWGLLYHHSVCPYCIQFESRDSGCAYMTHENSRGESVDKSPYCDPRFQIPELVERYKAVSENGPAAHLEFCAECGRPCVDHAHITTKPPYTKLEVPIFTDAAGRRHHDYVTCTGGGRTELFARILAIRRVYREGASLRPLQERRYAALAADDAPNDEELMAQAAEIFAQEEATRHWTNAPIPPTKPYDDPAYRRSNGNNSNSNSNAESQNGGRGRFRQTRRKHRKQSRKRS
jgi:hypothetical protein